MERGTKKRLTVCSNTRISTFALPLVLALLSLLKYHSSLSTTNYAALDIVEYSPREEDKTKGANVTLQSQIISESSVSDEARVIRMGKVRASDPQYADFYHFLSHVPKSGTTYAFKSINRLIHETNEYKALVADSEDLRFQACDEGRSVLRNYPSYRKTFKGRLCTMRMSERPYSWTIIPDNTYVILREPKSHVLSQYFHCTESRNHQSRRQYMPGSLDVWLETSVLALDNATQAKVNENYKCYDPRNFQSRWVDFNHMNLDLSDKGSKELLKGDLKERYRVLGDNSQMHKTICLIAMRYTGWVPFECNCTDVDKVAEATIKNIRHSRRQLGENDNRSKDKNGRKGRPRFVEGYNPEKHAHGVTHHGATFETTPQQDEWISKLTEIDRILYNIAVEIFEEQVVEAEHDFDVTVCDAFRERGNFTEPLR